jgi:hypothetical protein
MEMYMCFTRRITAILGLIILIVALGGCQEKPPPESLSPPPAKAKVKPPAATAPAAVAENPSEPSSDDLARRAVERRAIETVIWGMPAVNFDLMYQAMVRETGGGFNEIVYWSRLPDWKNQTLTPNPDSIYLMPFFNTKDGPIVIEIPPADEGVINGTIMDAWQMPLEDVGPAGVDKGAGGKYLVLPPDHQGKVPKGYVALPSSTYHGYALLRSILKSGSDADVANAVTYGKRIKVYPLSEAANPPGTTFRDAIDVVYDATIPYDWRFFESLDRFVQREVWLTRDKVMIDTLKSIGIEKGKPFRPDEATKTVLNAAAGGAHALLEMKYEQYFSPPYYDGSRWGLPASPEYMKAAPTGYADADSYPVDDRGVVFSFAFFTPKHLGEGQFYLMTIKDKAGQDLSGANSYRLTVPPNAPVTQSWSATAYDRETHALIRNLKWSSRSSQTRGLQTNPDGSVDIWLGPTAPADKESNWIPTVSSGKFEVLFRFYGPGTPVFDKTWRLPDIEKV